MRTADFDYSLPEELIAQNPPEHRGDSRMMVLHADTGAWEILPFRRIADFLRSGDCLTVNNTRVIRARLFALKETGAHLEIMLLHPESDSERWSCFLKPGKRAPEGTVLTILRQDGTMSPFHLTVVGKDPSGVCSVAFDGAPVDRILEECGHIPLPPYIKRRVCRRMRSGIRPFTPKSPARWRLRPPDSISLGRFWTDWRKRASAARS